MTSWCSQRQCYHDVTGKTFTNRPRYHLSFSRHYRTLVAGTNAWILQEVCSCHCSGMCHYLYLWTDSRRFLQKTDKVPVCARNSLQTNGDTRNYSGVILFCGLSTSFGSPAAHLLCRTLTCTSGLVVKNDSKNPVPSTGHAGIHDRDYTRRYTVGSILSHDAGVF